MIPARALPSTHAILKIAMRIKKASSLGMLIDELAVDWVNSLEPELRLRVMNQVDRNDEQIVEKQEAKHRTMFGKKHILDYNKGEGRAQVPVLSREEPKAQTP